MQQLVKLTILGVAYCKASSTGLLNKQIEIVYNQPSQHTKIGTKEKVPSKITYQLEGLIQGSLILLRVTCYMQTKLQLDNQQISKAAKIFYKVATSQRDAQKQLVDIVSNFLT